MANNQVERVSAAGQETPVTKSANVQAATPAPVTQEARNETRTSLPKTASEIPLVALSGFLFLVAGLGLASRRRMRAL